VIRVGRLRNYFTATVTQDRELESMAGTDESVSGEGPADASVLDLRKPHALRSPAHMPDEPGDAAFVPQVSRAAGRAGGRAPDTSKIHRAHGKRLIAQSRIVLLLLAKPFRLLNNPMQGGRLGFTASLISDWLPRRKRGPCYEPDY
jgi:hypothetical protein